ncbi:MAG: SGNH/GDSL hydrolase family protein [Planctomycetes bacterium]|nr:SGNH/GDSL hydrolase family protein [Planctomycetota bacterium]
MTAATNATANGGVRRRRRLGPKLLLLGAALLLPLLCCELFLQLVDPGGFGELEDRERFSAEVLERTDDHVLRLVPGVTSSYLGQPVQVSAQRLRNREVVVPKPADVYRILVLGDSVPFGWGVGEDDPFPRRLEAALRDRPRRDGRRYEVVNAGSPGWGLVEEYVWLRDQGMAFEPDLVLHCIINNDIDPHPMGPPLFLTETLRKVRTLRLLERIAQKFCSDRGNVPGSGVPPADVVMALDKFQELCAPKGTRYVVFDTVGLPAIAIEHAAQIGVPRIDTVVSEDWIHAHQVTPSDFHPGPEGHRIFAERALAGLQPLLEP